MWKNILKMFFISILALSIFNSTYANVDLIKKTTVNVVCDSSTWISTVTIRFKANTLKNYLYERKYKVTWKGSFTIPGSINETWTVDIPWCKCIDSDWWVEIIEAYDGANFNWRQIGWRLTKATKNYKAVSEMCGEYTYYFPGLNYWSNLSSGSKKSSINWNYDCKSVHCWDHYNTACVTTTKMRFVREAESCTPPVKPECGTTHNECVKWNPVDLNNTDTYYKWMCVWNNWSNSMVSCQEAKPVILPECSTEINQCIKWSFFDINDNNNYYKWKCAIDDNEINCQKPKPINPECSTERSEELRGSKECRSRLST